jgi:hypothetical protein
LQHLDFFLVILVTSSRNPPVVIIRVPEPEKVGKFSLQLALDVSLLPSEGPDGLEWGHCEGRVKLYQVEVVGCE